MIEVRQYKQLQSQLNKMVGDADALKIEVAIKQKEHQQKLKAIENLKIEMAKSRNLNDFVGKKFNRLTFINECEPKITSGGNKKRAGIFLCDCGIKRVFTINDVISGGSKSCGCYNIEKSSERAFARNYKHGLNKTTEYNTWSCMKKRCLNPKNKNYKNYGARGIKVCDSWLLSFENFINDMGLKPSKNHSLERTENDSDYSKENCIWGTKKQQSRNARSNILFSYLGQTKCLGEWVEFLKMTRYQANKFLKLNGENIN